MGGVCYWEIDSAAAATPEALAKRIDCVDGKMCTSLTSGPGMVLAASFRGGPESGGAGGAGGDLPRHSVFKVGDAGPGEEGSFPSFEAHQCGNLLGYVSRKVACRAAVIGTPAGGGMGCKTLVAGGDESTKGVLIWDVGTGGVVARLQSHS